MDTVLILGSGPNVVAARNWPRDCIDKIVAINHAWAVRPDWDDAIYPWDFPTEKHPNPNSSQRAITEDEFVPAQNAYGGFVYAGATMAFTAAYWALHEYRPKVIAMMGCDMHYPITGATHFYGSGAPDPLRKDITLQSLEAKAARLQIIAARQGCAMVNLSRGPSRLVFPRTSVHQLRSQRPEGFDKCAAQKASGLERFLNYATPSGRYWEELSRFDPARLRQLDAIWLDAHSDEMAKAS